MCEQPLAGSSLSPRVFGRFSAPVIDIVAVSFTGVLHTLGGALVFPIMSRFTLQGVVGVARACLATGILRDV